MRAGGVSRVRRAMVVPFPRRAPDPWVTQDAVSLRTFVARYASRRSLPYARVRASLLDALQTWPGGFPAAPADLEEFLDGCCGTSAILG
jgi:hypothetical protein